MQNAIEKSGDALPWITPEQCEGCADCVSACPVYGIEMWESDNSEFHIPWLSNPDSCIGCGKCEGACTWGAISMTTFIEDARKRLFTKKPIGLLGHMDKKKINLRDLAKKKIAVVLCLDCKLHLESILQEDRDNAFIIRNSGNVISDCVIRSLVVADSLGAEEIVVIGHRMCDVRDLDHKELGSTIEKRTGGNVKDILGKSVKKWLEFDRDPEENLKRQVANIRESKLLQKDMPITALMYDEFGGHIYKVL